MTELLTTLISSGILDRINSVVELAILLPFAADCFHIHRVRTSISINAKSVWVWFSYCVWTTCYFAALGQSFSFYSGLVWIAAYVVKIGIVRRYRPRPALTASEGP